MHTLMIKDLSAAKELDRKAMSAVRGGSDYQSQGSYQGRPQMMGDPVPPAPSPNPAITLLVSLLL